MVLLAAAPAANGGPMPPPGRHSLPRLDLTAPGLELAVQRPVSLSVTADGVTIRLE